LRLRASRTHIPDAPAFSRLCPWRLLHGLLYGRSSQRKSLELTTAGYSSGIILLWLYAFVSCRLSCQRSSATMPLVSASNPVQRASTRLSGPTYLARCLQSLPLAFAFRRFVRESTINNPGHSSCQAFILTTSFCSCV